MKNIHESQLKTCITLGYDEFRRIVNTLYDADLTVEYTADGIDIYSNDGKDCISIDKLKTKLAEYFDVSAIKAIHIDHYNTPDVWLTYENDIIDIKPSLYETSKYHFIDEESGYLQYNKFNGRWMEYDSVPHTPDGRKKAVRDATDIMPKGRFAIIFTDPMYYDVDTGEFTKGKETVHMNAYKVDTRYIVNYFAVNTKSELKALLDDIVHKDITHGMWGWIVDTANKHIIYADVFGKIYLQNIMPSLNKAINDYLY